MTTRQAWNGSENAACVALYFAMLDRATAGEPYNKAAMIRSATGELTAEDNRCYVGPWYCELSTRSRGSIEAKLMNCSAAHARLDPNAITMDGFGYRALANYQASLADAMRIELGHRAAAAPLRRNFAR